MHFSKLLTFPLLVSAGASALAIDNPDSIVERDLAKRSCYTAGEAWGSSKNLALQKVDEVCKNNFRGRYRGKSERNACRNLGDSGKRVDFTVRRWKDNDASMDFATCKKYLRLEIVGCTFGGISYRGNWRFRSDANSGPC
ncbi:hypothetical protein FSARC_9085 [Fusarium sarcochroum]|uniref:Secreted protein n=1 Tax=Fusarium sarcochroum TaxID=1208366 RepID=A0A8H4TRT1_9HYPO|nr:hypothetical protein FSARC_9085 [Fusarium sarcochroum]